MPPEDDDLLFAAFQQHLDVIRDEWRLRDAHHVPHASNVAHYRIVGRLEEIRIGVVDMQHTLGGEGGFHRGRLVDQYDIIDRQLELRHHVALQVANHEIRSQAVLQFSVAAGFLARIHVSRTVAADTSHLRRRVETIFEMILRHPINTIPTKVSSECIRLSRPVRKRSSCKGEYRPTTGSQRCEEGFMSNNVSSLAPDGFSIISRMISEYSSRTICIDRFKIMRLIQDNNIICSFR